MLDFVTLSLPVVFEQHNLYMEKGLRRCEIDSAAMNVLVIGIDVCELNYMPKRVHANEMFVTFDSRQGKESNMFHNYETEKITRKARDAAEKLQLYRVVLFFRPRSSCTTTHLMLFSERTQPQIYAQWLK